MYTAKYYICELANLHKQYIPLSMLQQLKTASRKVKSKIFVIQYYQNKYNIYNSSRCTYFRFYVFYCLMMAYRTDRNM